MPSLCVVNVSVLAQTCHRKADKILWTLQGMPLCRVKITNKYHGLILRWSTLQSLMCPLAQHIIRMWKKIFSKIYYDTVHNFFQTVKTYLYSRYKSSININLTIFCCCYFITSWDTYESCPCCIVSTCAPFGVYFLMWSIWGTRFTQVVFRSLNNSVGAKHIGSSFCWLILHHTSCDLVTCAGRLRAYVNWYCVLSILL